MTLTLSLGVKGFGSGDSEKEVRIFSLRGAHLIGMFSRTKLAKEFRFWVLDILDQHTAQLPQKRDRNANPHRAANPVRERA